MTAKPAPPRVPPPPSALEQLETWRRLQEAGLNPTRHSARRVAEMHVPVEAVVDLVVRGSSRPSWSEAGRMGRIHTHEDWPAWAAVTGDDGVLVTLVFRETETYERAGRKAMKA